MKTWVLVSDHPYYAVTDKNGNFSIDNILNELKENNLDQILFDLPAGDWDSGDRGLAADPNRINEFEDGVGLAIEFANSIKPINLTCLVGKVPSGVSDTEAQDTLIKNLTFAAHKLDELSLIHI